MIQPMKFNPQDQSRYPLELFLLSKQTITTTLEDNYLGPVEMISLLWLCCSTLFTQLTKSCSERLQLILNFSVALMEYFLNV